jgi:hypothetical protein
MEEHSTNMSRQICRSTNSCNVLEDGSDGGPNGNDEEPQSRPVTYSTQENEIRKDKGLRE